MVFQVAVGVGWEVSILLNMNYNIDKICPLYINRYTHKEWGKKRNS